MSRWREQKLRADNTSVVVVFFEEGGTHPCHHKTARETESAEAQTDTDTASEVSETPRELSPSLVTEPQDGERPALVRSMAFRCAGSQPNELSSFVPVEEGPPPCIAQEITVPCTV